MYGSLRAFLQALEGRDDLLRVKRDVDPKFELAAVLKRIQRTSNLPVIFEKVRGSRYPVVSNTCGNTRIIAEMIGTTESRVAARWAEITAGDGKAPTEFFADEKPEFDEISLADVPHLIFSEKDAGPYITAGMITVRDPDSGVQNVSYHRSQMIGPTELRCRLSTSGDLFRVHKKLEDRGKPLEAAMLVGCAPALMLAGAMTIGPDNSELDFAARIAGKRFPMRACASIDLSVPSTTEFVIEGELLAGERRPEGPYGDWMDYYIPVMNNHVFRVRKVLARKDAMFYAVAAGSPEEMAMSAIPIAGMIYRAIRTYVPSVLDVVCYPFPQFCVVQIKKGFEGQARKAMLGAFGAEMNRLLYCVVVDEDVNAHDLRDVIWAMTTRCRPDRDVFIIPEVPSFARDPHQMHWGRMGIDATAPLEYGAEFERKRTPGEGDIRLEDYLS